jgi:hypothetical protein
MTELSVSERVLQALRELHTLDRQKWEAELPFQSELDDIQERMNSILGQMHESSAGISQHIFGIEAMLRQDGVKLDKTVKDVESGYQCVHVGAKRKWDNAKLEGYSAAHPEVLQCSEMCEPSVQIRRGK